jgi:hypothetical protein
MGEDSAPIAENCVGLTAEPLDEPNQRTRATGVDGIECNARTLQPSTRSECSNQRHLPKRGKVLTDRIAVPIVPAVACLLRRVPRISVCPHISVCPQSSRPIWQEKDAISIEELQPIPLCAVVRCCDNNPSGSVCPLDQELDRRRRHTAEIEHIPPDSTQLLADKLGDLVAAYATIVANGDHTFRLKRGECSHMPCDKFRRECAIIGRCSQTRN